MASPFAIFRRNQQTLLVVLFILAIFAFTLSDLLMSETVNLPMLGLIIGTCILTAVGVAMKQTAKYAAAGALGGLAAGFVASIFLSPGGPDAVAKTSLGTISEIEAENMLRERGIANNFIQMAAQQALGPQQAMAQMRGFMFGITGQVDREEALLSFLMLEEARRLGIQIDNEAVTDYINRVTDNKLSRIAYKEVLDGIGISDGELYRILSEQIAIRTAQQQLAPTGFMTPEQYWEMYKKMNFSQTIQSVGVPVQDFAEQIESPGEAELKAYFEAHKETLPGDPEPGSPGFRQPRKVQLAYIEASYLDLEETVDEITDEEIEKYYEENKDTLYLNRRMPEDPLGGGDPFGSDSGSGSTGPEMVDPNLPVPELDLDSLSPEQTPESDDPQPETEEPGNSPETDNNSGSESPATDKKSDNNSEEQPEPEKQTPEEESQSRVDSFHPTLQTVAFVQAEEEAENASESEDPKADDAPQPADAGQAKEDKKKSLPLPSEVDLEAPLRAPKPGDVAELPKYKPLDDLLRDEIRDDLLRERTREKLRNLASLVLDRMTALSNEYFDLETKKEKQAFIKAAQAELQELAEKHGLVYAQTPLMSQSELRQSTEHLIGSATLGMEPSNARGETVADRVFTLPPESVYEADVARISNPESIYVYWKTADREAHIPTWDEPGIQDQVLETWRLEQARPEAETRAKKLAEKLRNADAEETWSELLLTETTTGDEDGVVLHPLISDSFSWMSTSSAPSPFGFPMQVPVLTELSTVENAGPGFMETIFEEMDKGDIGVVPNEDKSIYYVVQIRERRPSDPEEIETQRDLFLKANLFPMSVMQFEMPTPYSFMVNSEGGKLYRDWLENLKRRYDVTMIAEKEDRSRRE